METMLEQQRCYHEGKEQLMDVLAQEMMAKNPQKTRIKRENPERLSVCETFSPVSAPNWVIDPFYGSHPKRGDRTLVDLKFLAEDYTLEDILWHVTRDDLKSMNLRGGTLCAIWKAIVDVREKQSS